MTAVAPGPAPCCSVCGCSTRLGQTTLSCSSCVCESLAPARARLTAACAKRDALRERASEELKRDAQAHATRAACAASELLVQKLQDVQRGRTLVASELREVAACCKRYREANHARRIALELNSPHHQRRDNFAAQAALHGAQLEHRLMLQALAAEKQRCIRLLRLALPLHWKRPTSGPSSFRSNHVNEPAFIRIGGAVLPTGLCDASVSDSSESAGLGLLLHFVSLAARYLGCPLMHVASFRGSTSTVWRRTSFASDAGSVELPLFRGGDGVPLSACASATAASSTASSWPSSVAQQVGVLGKVGRLLFDTAEVLPLPSDGWATPGPCEVPRLAGVQLLCRSVGVLCGHELGLAAAASPPPQWRPLALLAALCAGLAKPTMSQTAGSAKPATVPTLARDVDDSDDDSDWTHIEFTRLAPPPSCPEEEVQLWEQLTAGT